MTTYARLPWLFSAAFAGFGLIFGGIGWWWVAVQHYRLATYVPVQATILESRVVPGGKESYEPFIRYSYVGQERRYEANRVLAVGSVSTTGTWPWRVCAQFPTGASATAWRSPKNPADSILLRDVELFGHVFAMVGFVCFFVAAYALFQSIRGRRTTVAPRRRRDGTFDLRQEFPIRWAFYLSALRAVAWYAYYAVVLGDYLVLTKDPFDLSFLGSAAVTAGVGIFWIVPTWRCWRLCHDFTNARLSADRNQFRLGEAVRLRLDQAILRPLKIEELSLGAVCMRSDRDETRTALSASVSYFPAAIASSTYKKLEVNRDYLPGSQLSANCELVFPAHAPPSSPPNSTTFPIYQWFLVLEVAASEQPKLSVRFPIVVESGTEGVQQETSRLSRTSPSAPPHTALAPPPFP
jgi:hypothetical protein